MRKLKIFSILGTRPNFIKAFPLIKELQKQTFHKIIHTGQHYDNDMSKIFFSQLKLKKPKYLFKVLNKKSTNLQITEMIKNLEKIFQYDRPDLVIIYGDTSSSLAGAIASNKSSIPIVHIESGVRSGDKSMPEEINRIIIDNLSTLLFCPTKTGLLNLRKENIKKNVFFYGDTNLEAVNIIKKNLNRYNYLFSKYNIKKKNYIFLTVHRNFNADNKFFLKKLFNSIEDIKIKFIFPIHPRTKKNILKYKIKLPNNVLSISPLSYIESIFMQKNSKLIVTDSGGIQKEAFFLKIPCVTLRPNMEWTETLKYKNNILAYKSSKIIENAIKIQKNKKFRYIKNSFFGSNKISKNIAKKIIENFS